MDKWQSKNDLKCAFCSLVADSHDHLFFLCEFPKIAWKEIKTLAYRLGSLSNLKDKVNVLASNGGKNSIDSVRSKLMSVKVRKTKNVMHWQVKLFKYEMELEVSMEVCNLPMEQCFKELDIKMAAIVLEYCAVKGYTHDQKEGFLLV
ncbi:hypothetical protein Tco_1200351 [Tanacetum coccineum]